MAIGEVVGTILVVSLVIWASAEMYDIYQVKIGVFPKKSQTTLDDIKRLRDSGHKVFAIRRFQQMPENKGMYTLRGAQKIVDKL